MSLTVVNRQASGWLISPQKMITRLNGQLGSSALAWLFVRFEQIAFTRKGETIDVLIGAPCVHDEIGALGITL